MSPIYPRLPCVTFGVQYSTPETRKPGKPGTETRDRNPGQYPQIPITSASADETAPGIGF